MVQVFTKEKKVIFGQEQTVNWVCLNKLLMLLMKAR